MGENQDEKLGFDFWRYETWDSRQKQHFPAEPARFDCLGFVRIWFVLTESELFLRF